METEKVTPYDPKLKAAAEEIKVILKKHDILASMLLVSRTHSEYLFHIESSWSVMKHEADENGRQMLRIRSKRGDFPTKEAQHEATEASVHAVTSFLQFGRMCQTNMQSILDSLMKHMKIGYKVWDSR